MSRKAIMIVEDDPDVRAALAAVLEGEGYAVVEAGDGAEALRQLRGNDIALVLLDLWMPVMDGWQFRAEQMRDPALARVPVVVVTADPAAGRQVAALGVQACMVKPVELPELLAQVNRYCGSA